MKNSVLLWLFWAYFIQTLSTHFASSVCHEEERSQLLQLRRNLNYSKSKSSKLVIWNQSLDCCQWSGVQCNSTTGRVIGLDLSSESITNSSDKLSSLFGLKFLQNLNLANNSFSNAEIPSGFGELASLTHLNLSNAGFSGQIPKEISRLSKLITLDLSSLSLLTLSPLKLENPSLAMLIRNLNNLIGLHLSGVVISANGSEWCKALSSSVPNLQSLSLSNCNLSGEIDASLGKLQSLSEVSLDQNILAAPIPDFIAKFGNLTTLKLSYCQLKGKFPWKILELPQLRSLDLSYNEQLQGTLPRFPFKSSFQTLVVSYTSFSGKLPKSIGNLQQLKRLELVNCRFSGSIPPSMEQLSQLVYVDFSFNNFSGSIPSFSSAKNLRYLSLRNNMLTGTIESREWASFPNLVNLDLSVNLLNGSIPMSLFSLPSLKLLKLKQNRFTGQLQELFNMSLILNTLGLSNNMLDGPVPKSLFKLEGLEVLNLSSNNFTGSLNLNEMQQLKNLSSLELSNNSLSVNANENNVHGYSFPQLSTLRLGSCNLQVLPTFLKKQSKLQYLELSGNNIRGSIPQWIWRVGNGSLVSLNLSHNYFTGLEGPSSGISALKLIDISSNMIQGEVPMLSSSKVVYLDYSNNSFTSISPNINDSLQYTIYLSLSRNAIAHEIPNTLCNASILKVLDLSFNNFSGTIPDCIIRMTSSLEVLNLKENHLSGNIVNVFPKGCKLSTLNMGNNFLQGQIPQSLVNCKQLEVLDIGRNQLQDTFPCWFRNLSNLCVLVLSTNKFYGPIACSPNNMGWPKLHIIDIASNYFDGELKPQCFSDMTALMNQADSQLMYTTQLQYPVLQFDNVYYQNGVALNFKGTEVYNQRVLTLLNLIDFSSNSFQGDIPNTLGNLKELIALNLSHNSFSGSIPSTIGNLSMLESLDLSQNNLSGSIPKQLTELNFLELLNLSYNKLIGRIPESAQFSTFDISSYIGNMGLCGQPLKNCSNSSITPSAQEKKQSPKGIFDWQSIFISGGFGTGAGLVIAPLVFCKKARKGFNKRVNNLISAILSPFGIDCATLDEVSLPPEQGIEPQLFDISSYYGDETDNERNNGRFCVFCTKLDIERKRVIHNPRCTCHGLQSSILASFSLSSSKTAAIRPYTVNRNHSKPTTVNSNRS